MASTAATRRASNAPTLAEALNEIICERVSAPLSARAAKGLQDIIGMVTSCLADKPSLGLNIEFTDQGTSVRHTGKVRMRRLHLVLPEDKRRTLAVSPKAIASCGVVLWNKQP